MAIPSAPATSPAMAAGRGSPNPMPAGLSALLKPDSNPRGMPSGSIQQIMNTARKMSDSQLADVLAGKSMDVPQYVAMTEAMGRKKLRTAMQGAQAQAQMQQPSVKDKLMAEEAVSPMMGQPTMVQPMQGQMPIMAAEGGLMYADGGIAGLSAPNMESMDMADGGIIAFNGEKNEQVVESNPELEKIYRRAEALNAPNMFTPNIGPYDAYQKLIGEPFSRFFSASPREQRVAFDKASEARKGERGTFTSAPADVARDKEKTVAAKKEDVTDAADKTRKDRMKQVGLNAVDLEEARAGNIAAFVPPVADKKESGAPARVAAAGPAPADSGMSGLKSYMDAIKANQEDYYKKVEGLGAKQREGLAQLRRQGGGEALMNIAQGLLSKAGLAQGVSAGLPGVIQTAAASRKEQRAVENLANEYDMNLAKARSADAKGNTEAALKYMQLADQAKYQAADIQTKLAALKKPTGELQVLQALQKPGESLNDTYARVSTMKQDPRTDQVLIGKHADYMKSTTGMMKPLSFEEWLQQNGYVTGRQQVAGVGQPAYSAVYDASGKRI
jgi:hypothetical protein